MHKNNWLTRAVELHSITVSKYYCQYFYYMLSLSLLSFKYYFLSVDKAFHMKSIWSLTVVELTIMQSRIPHKRIISSTGKFDESRDNV